MLYNKIYVYEDLQGARRRVISRRDFSRNDNNFSPRVIVLFFKRRVIFVYVFAFRRVRTYIRRRIGKSYVFSEMYIGQ